MIRRGRMSFFMNGISLLDAGFAIANRFDQ